MPHKVRVDPDLRIPLHDGRHLSARLWLPEDEAALPVPAVVEYMPYRHRDFTYPRDAVIHPWFAGHGFASIRLESELIVTADAEVFRIAGRRQAMDGDAVVYDQTVDQRIPRH